MTFAVLLSLLAGACQVDVTIGSSATDGRATPVPPAGTSVVPAPADTPTPEDGLPPAESAASGEGLEEIQAAVRPSELLPLVSLIYTGRIGSADVERDLGELTRCVAMELDESVSVGDLGSFDPDEDSVVLLASLDPTLLAATTTALDACVSPVVLVSEAFSSGRIERFEHAQARCLIDLLGDGTRWADVVAVYQSGRPFPFGDLDQAREACRELPGADQPLTDEEQATADWLVDLAEVIGFELTRAETACIIVGSRGAVDPGLTIDLNDADGEVIQRLDPVTATLDTPVELAERAVGDLQLTAEALWATDNNAGTLLRLDLSTGQILDEITIAPGDWYSSDLTTAAGWLWLTTREDPVVRQLNPLTGDLVAEYQVDSQYTTHLIDQGDAVGIYGFSQLWRIEDGQAQAEQLIDDYGQEGLDPDAAIAVGGVVAFADENVSVLAIRDSASGFIEQLRLIPGLVDSDRDRIATDGTDIWLTTYDDLLVRFGG